MIATVDEAVAFASKVRSPFTGWRLAETGYALLQSRGRGRPRGRGRLEGLWKNAERRDARDNPGGIALALPFH
jgi:hypothetical protein